MNATLERCIRQHNRSLDSGTGWLVLPDERLAALWLHGVVTAESGAPGSLASLRIGINDEKDRGTVLHAGPEVFDALRRAENLLAEVDPADVRQYGFDYDEATLRTDAGQLAGRQTEAPVA
jgi:hypothetical protein